MGQALIDQYSSLVDSRSRWLANKAPWLSAAEDFERALAAGQVAPEREKRVRSEEAFARGRYAALSGDLAQAESQLRAATELDRAWAPPYLELASLLTRLGRFDEAHGMARHALQVEPGLWLTAVCEGPIYAAEGKPFDAVGVYESAQARFALPLVQGNLALAYHATGQNDASAERLARQALERDPDLPPALIVLADRALERGNAAEALGHTQRLVDTALFDVTAWLLHGDALLGSKQNALARQAYERAVELYEKTRQTGAPPQRLAIVRAALARGELPPPRGDATGPEGRPHPAAPRDRPRPAAGGAGRGISARDLGFGL
jgi:tetratricopeptide (TPR) repeat protein